VPPLGISGVRLEAAVASGSGSLVDKIAFQARPPSRGGRSSPELPEGADACGARFSRRGLPMQGARACDSLMGSALEIHSAAPPP
jgi:hypothetical protein